MFQASSANPSYRLSTTENLLPLSHATSTPLFSSICIDTPVLGQLPSTIGKEQHPHQQTLTNLDESTQMSSNAPDPIDHGDESEIELFVNNVVCSFALGCQLNLRKIAMEAANVIYRRDQSVSSARFPEKNRPFVRFAADGFDENSKSVLFGEFVVVGQSHSDRNDQVRSTSISRRNEFFFAVAVKTKRNERHDASLVVFNVWDLKSNSETFASSIV